MKAVLIVLAYHEHRQTRRCYPSIDTIATESGMSARGVRKILKRLGALDLIVKQQSKGGIQSDGKGVSNHYQIRLDTCIQCRNLNPEPECNQTLNASATNPEPECNQTLNASATNPEHGSPKVGTNSNKKEEHKDRDGEFCQFTDYFCQKFSDTFNAKYHFQRAKDAQSVKRLFADYDLEQLKISADRFFQSDDPFIMKAGYTITVFESQINKLSINQDPGDVMKRWARRQGIETETAAMRWARRHGLKGKDNAQEIETSCTTEKVENLH